MPPSQTNSFTRIKAGGLEFAYSSAGKGPLVLCLHGFPDSPHSWRDLLPKLAEAGYHAVAPATRGYYPSEIPWSPDYSPLTLGQDILNLIEALGYEEAIVIGHDWGALAAYAAANLKPERVRKLITLAIPHPRVLKPSLKGLWVGRHFINFQFKGWIRKRIRKNNFAYLKTLYNRWSPTWEVPEAELSYAKEAFTQIGRVDAALGYYWSFAENRKNLKMKALLGKQTSVPAFCLVGADDPLAAYLMAKTPGAYSSSYSYEIVPGTGHFLHREQPEQVNQLILGFLKE